MAEYLFYFCSAGISRIAAITLCRGLGSFGEDSRDGVIIADRARQRLLGRKKLLGRWTAELPQVLPRTNFFNFFDSDDLGTDQRCHTPTRQSIA